MSAAQKQETAAQKVLGLAKAAGAQQASARLRLTKFVEVGFRDGGLEKASASTKQGLNLRLFVDGRFGVHMTSDLRENALKAFVDQAVAMTRLLEPDKHRSLADASRYPSGPAPDLGLYDPHLAEPQAQDWIERARTMEKLAAKAAKAAGGQGPQVVSTQGGAYAEMSRSVLATSGGFVGSLEETGCFAGCTVVLLDPKDGQKRRSGGWWEGYRQAHELDAKGRMADIAGQAASRAAAQVGAKPGPSGSFSLVVENAAAGRLLSNLLTVAQGSTLHQKRSCLAGKLGQVVASPLLTMGDEPLLRGGFASRWFDGEGVAAAPLVLVQDGILQNYYLDTYYSRTLELPPTTASSSNLVLTPSQESGSAALAAQVNEGLFVTGFLGGNFNTTTGDFSLGVQGHWLKDGQRTHPVEGMNMAGNLLELLGSLEAVGNDPYPFAALRAPGLRFAGVKLAGA